MATIRKHTGLWMLFIAGLLGLSILPRIFEKPEVIRTPIYLTGVRVTYWHGITPLVTNRAGVETMLGTPDQINSLNGFQRVWSTEPVVMVYRYKNRENQDLQLAMNEIYFSADDTVSYIVEATFADPIKEEMQVEDIINLYGYPEDVTWSLRAAVDNVLLYCNQGVIVHANEVGIGWILYFHPMEFESCKDYFKNEMAFENPWVGTDMLYPQDPWNFDNKD